MCEIPDLQGRDTFLLPSYCCHQITGDIKFNEVQSHQVAVAHLMRAHA